MSKYILLVAGLLLACATGIPAAHAAPRIIRSNSPAAGNAALWLILKKETKGQYVLLLNHEGQGEAERFKLTTDTAGNAPLKFEPGEEARATVALKDVQDVITHTTSNDAEASGDAGGDINSFINEVLRKDGAEGVLIIPAMPPAAVDAPQANYAGWLWLAGGLLAGAAGGFIISKAMNKSPQEFKASDDPEDDSVAAKPTIVDAAVASEVAEQKLKKTQKDLKEAKAALSLTTKNLDSETAKNAALEDDYQALEARVKTADGTIVTMHSRLAGVQTELHQLQTNAAAQKAYFDAAATGMIRPFTDFVSSTKINPVDQVSQAIVTEQIILMAFHYYSLVRFGAGIWDEHDIYNLQRIGSLGNGLKAANPLEVSVQVKSGYPNLVLTLAELLRHAGANGTAMDVSIRGYRFGQKAV